MDITAIEVEPYQDQVFGTSGIRKKVSVFKQKNYVATLVQSVFDSLPEIEGKTLIIGGDGRYYNAEAIQIILKIAIANQIGRIVIGQNGLLSTPATSHVIVKYRAMGGFILSASHNPGGEKGDFGIKYDNAHGAPATQDLTDKISLRTKTIDRVWQASIPEIDLSQVGEKLYGQTVVQVIDSVADYAEYMQQIFDFKALQKLFKSGFKMTFDSMNAATGPYASYIFEDLLKAPKGTVVHARPLPDFGGLHPEPNLTYATDLVKTMSSKDGPDFGVASDGDGDRYMIMGKNFFVNPSDSLAVLAEYLDIIPFYKGKLNGVARSMPTSFAVDSVAKSKKIDLYQTPTGWKFFGNLLTAGKIALCGEESFGAGSFHLQEKDGIWAILCWLSIIAKTGKMPQELVEDLWQKHGRVYAQVRDYAGLDSKIGHTIISHLMENASSLKGKVMAGHKITESFVFNYTDPITNEVIQKQGVCVMFGKNERIVFRLSGTSSVGATLKVYLNKRLTNPKDFHSDVSEVLSDLSAVALELSELKSLTGIEKPTMMT